MHEWVYKGLLILLKMKYFSEYSFLWYMYSDDPDYLKGFICRRLSWYCYISGPCGAIPYTGLRGWKLKDEFIGIHYLTSLAQQRKGPL